MGLEPLDRLPRGSRDLLPNAAAARRRAQAKLLKLFDRWGFLEVVPPLVEYGDARGDGGDGAGGGGRGGEPASGRTGGSGEGGCSEDALGRATEGSGRW